MRGTLAFDIGGTKVASAVVGEDLSLLVAPQQRPMPGPEVSSEAPIEVLQALGRAQRERARALGCELAGVGLGLPGPSDYLSGTPWMRHKLAGLRGRSLVPLLGIPERPTAAVNDAAALALGEAAVGAGQGARRLLALTLGTGLGSAYLVEGRVVHEGPGVPPGGQLWRSPFAGSSQTVEEEVGRAALETRYAQLGGVPGLSLEQVAGRAREGDGLAQELFDHLGRALAIALAASVRDFAPGRIVVGGGIARSHQLFLPLCEQQLATLLGHRVAVVPARLGLGGALIGAARALQQRLGRFARRRLVYLHGFASSPGAAKAVRFADALARRGVSLEIPDLNEGDFTGLTISRQLALLERLTADQPPGSVVLIGSSLGAYTAALQAVRSPSVAALVLMAPAFDFAARWVAGLGAERVAAWQRRGVIPTLHHATGEELPIGWSLVEDGRRHAPFPDVRVPTLVFHGRGDEVVDPELSQRFAAERPNVELELLDADHGLAAALDRIVERSLSFLSFWWC